MNLLERISKLFSTSSSRDEAGYWIYVCCDRCGETVGARINLYNDLSIDYEGEKGETYLCRKTIVGRQGCFQRVEIELRFDRNRKLIEREISGGIFVEAEEFSAVDR